MSQVQISVSIEDVYLDRVSQVMQELQSAGMIVEQSLPTLGIISGSMAADQVDRLSQVEGVQSIELERGYQLPPPESDMQ